MKFETIVKLIRNVASMRSKANIPTECYMNTGRSGQPIIVIGFGTMPSWIKPDDNNKNLNSRDNYQELSYAKGDETFKLNPVGHTFKRISLQQAKDMIQVHYLQAKEIINAREDYKRKVLTYMDQE